MISVIREAEATRDAKIAQYKTKPNPKQPARSYSQQLDTLSLYGQSSPFSPEPKKGNYTGKNKSKKSYSPDPSRPKPTARCPVRVMVCYKCGEFNHYEKECKNPPNKEKKNRNLARRKEIIEAWEAMNEERTLNNPQN